MLVEIKTTEFSSFKGIAKVSGNPYEIHKQDALIHLNGEIRKVELMLSAKMGEQPTPHEAGEYEVNLEDNAYFDRNGNLVVTLRDLGPRL